MTKKILFIGDSNSIHIKKWVDYFIKCKYEVAIATFAKINISNCSTVFYLSRNKIKNTGGNYQYLFSINKLSKIIQEFKPHYINAHYSYSMGLIGLLALKLSGLNARLSVVCHGSDILDMPHPLLYKILNKYVLNECDKIFSVSSQITETIQHWNITSSKIWTGQYGVEKSIINIDYKDRDIDIISNRNYVPNSRIDQLLESLNHQFFFDKNIVFILPGIDQKNFEFFKKQYPFINFYGSLPHEQVIGYIKRSKIYISATRSDGASLSLLEALACGCYPICSNIASNREWIMHNVNGSLFFSFDELRPSIIHILSSDTSNVAELNKKLIFERGLYDIQMKKIKKFLVS